LNSPDAKVDLSNVKTKNSLGSPSLKISKFAQISKNSAVDKLGQVQEAFTEEEEEDPDLAEEGKKEAKLSKTDRYEMKMNQQKKPPHHSLHPRT